MNNIKGQNEVEFKYYAFISYKHANAASGLYENDGAWANALDKELRYLNIPTEIDKSVLIHEDDDAVDPIFKDTSTLTIVPGGELERELTEKLKESKTLVLILSKDMIKDQNERYDPNPKKSTAWIYWEVKTFLKYHENDWSRIIPVYIDKDDYSPHLLKTRIGIENHFDNIEKPYHDYRAEHDWNTEKTMFYQKTAAAVASDIFKVEKRAFWSIKEKAKEALEAERKRARSQKLLWIVVAFIIAVLAILALVLRQMSISREYLNEARLALESGNRIEANQLAGRACRSWLWTKGAAEVLWASKDSTRSCIQVNSRVCVSDDMKTISYLDKNKHIVFRNAETFDEEDRIDIGAAQDFIMSGNGDVIVCFNRQDRNTQIELIDRTTGDRESASLSSPHFYTENVVINQNGDILYLDRDYAYMRGVGQVFVHTGIQREELEEQQYRSLSRELCSASFYGRDSILLVASKLSGSKGSRWALEFYNMKRLTGGNYTDPIASIQLSKNTERCFLSPYKPYMYVATKDSLYAYTINVDGDCSIHRKCGDSIPDGIEEIRFTWQSYYDDVDLVIDKNGVGKMFYISGGGITNGKPNIGFYESYYDKNSSGRPITLSGLAGGKGGPNILKYADSPKTINVRNSYRGFQIPNVTNGECINGYCLKYMTIITVSNQKKYIDSNRYVSYVFHGGDKRKVTFFSHAPHFFSSDYAVHSSFELFVDSTSRHYSAALYHPLTNEFVLDISQKEDVSMDKVSPYEYRISNRWLAASMRHADGRFSLRVFNLKNKSLTGEITIPGDWNSIHLFKWMSDDVLLLSTSDGLCRIDMNHPQGLFCEIIDKEFSQRAFIPEDITNDNVFEYYRSPAFYYNRTWYIHNAERNNCIMPDTDRDGFIKRAISNTGKYYSSYDPQINTFSLISVASADTLWTTHTEGNDGYWERFSADDRYFLYATNKNEIHCISLKTFKNTWTIPVHIPLSCLIGEKYAIIASSSIFVVNLHSGKIVAEFPNYPMKEQIIKMSPDEDYLLCGECLYSISGNQKLADGFSGECVALENEYIVFSNYLMELPKLPALFERID